MTGVRVQGDEPADTSDQPRDDSVQPSSEPSAESPELTPAELAALKAAKAAKKAERAQRRAEKARRLAAEYARAEQSGDAPVGPAPATSVPAESATVKDAPTAPRAAASRQPLIVAGSAAAAALVFAVVALVVYLTSGPSGSGTDAATRDSVLLSARQDVVVLNTLDYRNVDAGLKRWADASTGSLHQQVTSATATEKQQILAGKTVTTAKVLDAAVVSLDISDGSASVIASVELTKQVDGKTVPPQRERLRATMTRDGSTWKISGLQTVGVTLG